MEVIGADETRLALPMQDLIVALRTAFAAGEAPPERCHYDVHGPANEDGILLVMPAWAGGVLGTKIATIFTGNGAKGLPTVFSTYLLCDSSTGTPLALIDGNEITARRTIAVSALAASFLAREDAASLLVVGAGRIGALAASAFATVRPIRKVSVWSRNPAKAEGLVSVLDRDGIAAEAVVRLDEAVASADIVSCATPSNEPLIRGQWLRPGAHLDLIGSFTPDMREADDRCFEGATVYADSAEALTRSGDLAAPIGAGIITSDEIGTLSDLCAGNVTGRRSAHEITIFKSVGTALADLAAASLVHATLLQPIH